MVMCIVQLLSVACYMPCSGREDRCENLLEDVMSLWSRHLKHGCTLTKKYL